jgi:hypothetical protein
MSSDKQLGAQENHVVFLENFFNELQRKVPAGTWRHTPLMAELSRKRVIRNGCPDRAWMVGDPGVISCGTIHFNA